MDGWMRGAVVQVGADRGGSRSGAPMVDPPLSSPLAPPATPSPLHPHLVVTLSVADAVLRVAPVTHC